MHQIDVMFNVIRLLERSGALGDAVGIEICAGIDLQRLEMFDRKTIEFVAILIVKGLELIRNCLHRTMRAVYRSRNAQLTRFWLDWSRSRSSASRCLRRHKVSLCLAVELHCVLSYLSRRPGERYLLAERRERNGEREILVGREERKKMEFSFSKCSCMERR